MSEKIDGMMQWAKMGTWRVSASVERGNGTRDTTEVAVEGIRSDAESALWSLLETLGVRTAIERDDSETGEGGSI